MKNVVITLTFEIIVGDCSLESGFPSSWLPDLTLFTLNRPFLVKEFVFGVFELADIMLAAIILFSVEILNLPFLVREFELNSAELPIFPIDEPYGLQKENMCVFSKSKLNKVIHFLHQYLSFKISISGLTFKLKFTRSKMTFKSFYTSYQNCYGNHQKL